MATEPKDFSATRAGGLIALRRRLQQAEDSGDDDEVEKIRKEMERQSASNDTTGLFSNSVRRE